MTVVDQQDDDPEKREFVGSERKELRSIIWHFRFRRRVREAAKVWLTTAGFVASATVALSTIYQHWMK